VARVVQLTVPRSQAVLVVHSTSDAVSLTPERDNRIYPQRSTRRDVRTNQRYEDQQHGYGEECCGIVRRDTEEQARDRARTRVGAHDAERHTRRMSA
jgi:hypothetical protein